MDQSMIRFFQNLFAGRKTNYLAELPEVNTKIEIYKADWCSHCRTALRLLSKINATNIHIYDIEKQRDKGHEMVRRSGRYTIPQIFIGDEHVGGSDDLIKAATSGRLLGLLMADHD